MEYLLNVALLLTLVIVFELAIIVHATLAYSIGFNADKPITVPPLFRPRWRLLIYAFYILAGLAAVEEFLSRPLGVGLTVIPVAVLVILDLIALRRTWAAQTVER